MADKKTTSIDFKGGLGQLENTLDLYFGKKAPALPKDIKEIIVKLSPYLVALMLILSLPAILAVLGISAFFMPVSYGFGLHYGFNYTLGIIFLVISVVISALALPGLFKRAQSAWRLMFYSSLVSLVQNLVSFNWGALIIGGLVSFYILFQVREYYKN